MHVSRGRVVAELGTVIAVVIGVLLAQYTDGKYWGVGPWAMLAGLWLASVAVRVVLARQRGPRDEQPSS